MIFQVKRATEEKVWEILTCYIKEIVRNNKWTDKDQDLREKYTRIVARWGIRKEDLGGEHKIVQDLPLANMNSWYHPLRGTFKLNFDGS